MIPKKKKKKNPNKVLQAGKIKPLIESHLGQKIEPKKANVDKSQDVTPAVGSRASKTGNRLYIRDRERVQNLPCFGSVSFKTLRVREKNGSTAYVPEAAQLCHQIEPAPRRQNPW